MFWAVQQSLLFPLLILSGMMAAARGRTRWIRAWHFQPADLHRGRGARLFSGTFNDPAIGWAVLAAVITCAAASGWRQAGCSQHDLRRVVLRTSPHAEPICSKSAIFVALCGGTLVRLGGIPQTFSLSQAISAP